MGKWEHGNVGKVGTVGKVCTMLVVEKTRLTACTGLDLAGDEPQEGHEVLG